jgi:hypothetical protein
MSFLYLLTGCLDLARIAGQKKQRLPQAGKTCREITPETTLIFPISNIYDQKYFKLASKVCFLSLLNQSRTRNFDAREGKERLPSKWAPPKFNDQPEIQNVGHSLPSYTSNPKPKQRKKQIFYENNNKKRRL